MLRDKFRKFSQDFYYRRNITQSDTVLASFPKSGNTWISFFIASIICERYGIGRTPNFFNILEFVPELNKIDRLPSAPFCAIPRVLKTHDRLNRQFRRVLLLVRNPEDVMISYYCYLRGLGLLDEKIPFPAFVKGSRYGIAAWVRHTESYMPRARLGKTIQIFRYEDMLHNPRKEGERIVEILGIDARPEILDVALSHAGRDSMKRLESATRSSKYTGSSDFNFVGGRPRMDKELPDVAEGLSVVRSVAASLMKELGYSEG